MLLAAFLVKMEDGTPKQALQPLFPLLLGVSMICLSQQAIAQGRVFGSRRPISKNKHPVLFWSSVGIYLTCGFILSAAGIWLWI